MVGQCNCRHVACVGSGDVQSQGNVVTSHPFFQVTKIAPLFFKLGLEHPDCQADGVDNMVDNTVVNALVQIGKMFGNLLCICQHKIVNQVFVFPVAHHHHHIESMCMVKTSHQLLNVVSLMASQEQTTLA